MRHVLNGALVLGQGRLHLQVPLQCRHLDLREFQLSSQRQDLLQLHQGVGALFALAEEHDEDGQRLLDRPPRFLR